jgi:ABC-type glycerol-3-phosphate transport system substrate-binding protein
MAGIQPFDICDVGLPQFFGMLRAEDLYDQSSLQALDLYHDNFFHQSMIGAGTWNGKVYGSYLDHNDNINGIFYNKDMIAAKGLEEPYDLYKKGEWTFSKFEEYIKELTVVKGSSKQYGIVMSNQLSELFLNANGGGVAMRKPDGSVVYGLDSQASIQVTTMLKDLKKGKFIHPQTMWNQVTRAFAEGEAAMLPYCWYMSVSHLTKSDVNFGFVKFPRPDDGEYYPNPVQDCRMYVMPKNLKDPEFTAAVYMKLSEVGPIVRQQNLDSFINYAYDPKAVAMYHELSNEFVIDPKAGADITSAQLAFYYSFQNVDSDIASKAAEFKSATQANLDDFYGKFKYGGK